MTDNIDQKVYRLIVKYGKTLNQVVNDLDKLLSYYEPEESLEMLEEVYRDGK